MAAGEPTGPDLSTGTTNGNLVPETATWSNYPIFITPLSVTAGTKYAIILRCEADEIEWAANTDGFADHSSYLSSDAGASWSIDTNYDNKFLVGYQGGASHGYQGGNDNVYNSLSGDSWVAQTFTASFTGLITSVSPRISRFPGSTPGTITVSIRNVESSVSKATTPSPANAATNVTLDQATLTWEDGGTSDNFDVYYGTESGNLTLVSSAQEGLSFTVTGITNGSPFDYLQTRYWRVDSRVGISVATGDEWSFTTIRLSAPGPAYWYSAGGFYYQLLIQDDGTYGDPPPTGTENVDYKVVSFSANFIRTNRKLIAAAKNALYYEAI